MPANCCSATRGLHVGVQAWSQNTIYKRDISLSCFRRHVVFSGLLMEMLGYVHVGSHAHLCPRSLMAVNPPGT